MELPKPPPEIALAALRALKTVALADGELHPLELELLEALQRHVFHTDHDVGALRPISPEALADAVPVRIFQERIIGGCVMMSLVDEVPTPAERAIIEGFADALGVQDATLADLHRIMDGHLVTLRLDLVRRWFVADRARKELREGGMPALLRVAASTLHVAGHADLAGRYHALEQLPDGTLGKEYWRFMQRNGLPLPGEPWSAPELIVFHDCLHVLAGYDTDHEGEMQIAAFQAAIRGHDPFGVFLLIVVQLHLGIQVIPIADAHRGLLQPEKMLAAYARGSRVPRNLVDEWTPQADFERPIEELRVALGIPV